MNTISELGDPSGADSRRLAEIHQGRYSVAAFDALLAADGDDTIDNAMLEAALQVLDTQHPEWRTWL